MIMNIVIIYGALLMMNLHYTINFKMEEKHAVYKFKNGDSSYSEYVIGTPRMLKADGAEYVQFINPTPGILLMTVDIPTDRHGDFEIDVKGSYMGLSIILDGHVTNNFKKADGSDATTENLMENLITLTHPLEGKSAAIKHSGTPLRFLTFLFDPVVVRLMLGRDYANLTEDFKNLIENPNPRNDLISSYKMPPCYAPMVEQLISASKTPEKEKMTITNRTNELFSTAVNDLFVMHPEKTCHNMKKADLDRLAEAKDIIAGNLTSPPKLKILSRMIGLNEMKLKTGFKAVYGTTVYEYVRKERMKWAKNLLESGYYNVSEAAWEVGYTNVSHFIACFTRHYSISPGRFIRSRVS